MISVNSNTILGVALDPSGRLAARKDRVDDRVFSYEFAYDAAGRLAQVTRDGVPVEEYAYDAQGRRNEDTSSFRSVLGRLHEYDDLGRLRKAGNVEYTYDHADRLASRAEGVRVTRYGYDREGRLKKVRLPNDHVIEYIHDPQGKRVVKLRDGAVVERYYWLDFIRLLAVHEGRDREKVRFEYGESRVPVAMRHKDMIYRIETDQVGSPLALVDRDERVVKRVIYDSFGNVVHDDNPKLKLPLAFAGGLWDKETKLVHFGHRDYDPDVGRFITKDPIGYAGGDSDLYGYCLDDPVNGVDPLGLKAQKQKPKKWLWKANPGACEKCQALDGRVFEETPQRPHPNCRCQIVAVDEDLEGSEFCKYNYRICLRDNFVTDATMERLWSSVEDCRSSSDCPEYELRKRVWNYKVKLNLRNMCEEKFEFCKEGDDSF
jgi:RHS repeat-associated protein